MNIISSNLSLCAAAILLALCVEVSAFVSHTRHFGTLQQHVASSPSLQKLHMVASGSNSTTTITSTTATIVNKKKSGIQLRESHIKKQMPNHDKGGPVEPIDSIDGFLHAIESVPKNSIVVVQYHAKWCKVCARVTVKMRQMAQRLQKKELPVPVSFISVEVSANSEICSTLGIKKFPFVQMYRNSECIVSFGTGPAHNFQRVVGGTLDQKLSLTEDQWEEFRTEFKTEIAQGLDHFEALRLSTFFEGDGSDGGSVTDDISP